MAILTLAAREFIGLLSEESVPEDTTNWFLTDGGFPGRHSVYCFNLCFSSPQGERGLEFDLN